MSTGRIITLAFGSVFLLLVAVSLAGLAPWDLSGAADQDGDAGSVESGPPLPDALAGLTLEQLVSGQEAIVQTERLHGKGLGQGLDQAWIGAYGSGQITVWVSRSHREADAEELLVRMTESIESSDTPFTGLEALEYPAGTVYGLDGMGQRHFYFRIGPDLFWVAAPPASAEEALDGLLQAAGVSS
ncbi:MAG: hypothetical protein Kow00129_16990 [Thermoleophilia bacterium]